MAVKTSHPSFARSVSAVRRIVLLSSITRTFRPWSFVLLPVTVWGNSFLYLAAYSEGSTDKRSSRFNISVHPLLCNARHVFRRSRALAAIAAAGADIFALT